MVALNITQMSYKVVISYPQFCLFVIIIYNCTVPTSQSETTDMQSHDNQPRQDDERSQMEINNGICVRKCC